MYFKRVLGYFGNNFAQLCPSLRLPRGGGVTGAKPHSLLACQCTIGQKNRIDSLITDMKVAFVYYYKKKQN